ncbi:hypothetical protein [uncultured Mailhella sp.]|uniref:hypothetical protein n=1 Tax=Desulfovibrio sp. SGI.169 TaxID=3420561 RepID=UPI002609EABE|nr:hypothetical protein [uncultured Mailhella sp.]
MHSKVYAGHSLRKKENIFESDSINALAVKVFCLYSLLIKKRMPCEDFYRTASFLCMRQEGILYQSQCDDTSSRRDAGDCRQQEFTPDPIFFGEFFCGEHPEKDAAAEADCGQNDSRRHP